MYFDFEGDFQKSTDGGIIPILLCAHEELSDNSYGCHGNHNLSHCSLLPSFWHSGKVCVKSVFYLLSVVLHPVREC